MRRPRGFAPNWYKTSFDTDYELIYKYTDDTAPKEVSWLLRYLGLSPGRATAPHAFLDIGCGWGRHDILLAKKGYRVTGIDLSSVMLERGRRLAQEAGVTIDDEQNEVAPPADSGKLRFVRRDMRSLDSDEKFDFALNLFTSFGYFESEDENLKALTEIWRALRPGGQLLIDVDNPPQYLRTGLGTAPTTITDWEAEGREVLKESDVDLSRGRRVVRYEFTDEAREPIYLECELYDRRGLSAMLEAAGFAVGENVWGSFDGQRYSEQLSPRLIMVGKRPS